MSSNTNTRIAKNTMMLYIRMAFTMLVTLYTSRVVLNELGVEDYGIYNVVAGVVTLFGFITASMSTATSRFLTFSLGKGDYEDLKKTFAAATTIHLMIALFIILLAETIGLWFLENKLVIPEERMNAARVIYQFSIISTFFNILIVPYTASVFSHERMNIYAYIEMAVVTLKLAAVISLKFISFDKLILYVFLLSSVSLVHFISYFFYTRRNFTECRYKLTREKKYILPMLSFSGWDLYGNMSVVARTQGVNMLLNMFYGPVLNAASGIASQIQTALGAFASNVLLAVRPQIVKSYASENRAYTTSLINSTVKYTSLLLLLIFIPIIIEMPYVLRIWLVKVPEYTVDLSRLTLVFTFIANIASVIMAGIQATGNIKRSSVLNGSLYLLVLPITYFLFINDLSPVIPFVLNVLFVSIGAFLNIWYLHRYMKEFSIKTLLKKSILPVLLIGSISFFIVIQIVFNYESSVLRFLGVIFVSAVIILALTYIFFLDSFEKMKAKSIMCNLLKIKR